MFCFSFRCFFPLFINAQWYWNHPGLGVGLLNDIAVSENDHWWAVGRHGAVWRTTDGGATWHQQLLSTDLDLQSIFFINDELGWIAAESGKIFYTTDGGVHWDVISTTYDAYLTDIVFLDEVHGWCASEFGNILHTQDGGMTWTAQNPPGPYYALNSVFFTDLETGWACGEQGVIYHTTDGGENWDLQASADVDHDFRQIFFKNEQEGWAVGRIDFFPSACGIVKTENGGQDWIITDSIPNCQILTSIRFLDDNTGFVGGGWSINTFYRTDDGGDSWYPLMTDTGFYTSAIAFDQDRLIVAGGYGYYVENECDVFVSEDLGLTWQTYSEPLVWSDIRVVEAIDSMHVWFMHNSTGGKPGIPLQPSHQGLMFGAFNLFLLPMDGSFIIRMVFTGHRMEDKPGRYV